MGRPIVPPYLFVLGEEVRWVPQAKHAWLARWDENFSMNPAVNSAAWCASRRFGTDHGSIARVGLPNHLIGYGARQLLLLVYRRTQRSASSSFVSKSLFLSAVTSQVFIRYSNPPSYSIISLLSKYTLNLFIVSLVSSYSSSCSSIASELLGPRHTLPETSALTAGCDLPHCIGEKIRQLTLFRGLSAAVKYTKCGVTITATSPGFV